MDSHYIMVCASILAVCMIVSAVSAQTSPVKHFRSDKEFIEKAISLNREELAEVKKSLEQGDTDKAWEELLTHFRNRKGPGDPVTVRWSANPGKYRNKDSVLQRLARKDSIAQYREKGKVDWTHGNKPPRKDYEKYWSRNRLVFFGDIIQAANARNNGDLRKLCAGLFIDWYKQCPPPKLPVKGWYSFTVDGFAWREIEVGIRGRRLVSFFLATRSWDDVSDEFHRSLLISIQQNMDYLVSHLAKVGMHKGNHQTHHAPGLVAAGVLFPELKSSSAWKKTGLRILKEHIRLDNDSEGVQKEHSPSYHQGVTALYFDPYEVLSVNKHKPPKWMEDGLLKMLDFLLYSTTPDGRLVPLNDCFPGRTVNLRTRAADVFKRPDLLAIEGDIKTPLPATGRSFKTAGIAFMRSSWKKDAVYVVLDASGHGSNHWHAGKPNLVIHAGDQLLACDPQLASYDDPSFWKYFHTAQGHNTILVDGQGDGTPSDFWRFKHISKPKLTFFKHTDKADIAKGTTDGFKRLNPPVTFERRVLFVKPNLIFVEDILNSKGEHTYEWLLHLVPQKPVVDRKAKSMMTSLGGSFELICTPLPETADAVSGPSIRQGKYRNLTYGMSEGRGKYWSPPVKGKKPALMVNAPYGVWQQKGKGRIQFRFVLQVLFKGEKPLSLEKILAIEKKSLTEINSTNKGK